MFNKRPNTPEAVSSEVNNLTAAEKNTSAIGPVDSKTDRTEGWLGSSVRIKGDIIGTEDLLIDGSVEGMVQLDGRKLTVGKAAKLTADVNAREVVVYGFVKGNVRATGRIEIKRNGSVIGNLTTAQITIEDGADFKGTIEIDRSAAPKPADKPPSTRSASAGGERV